MKKTMILISGFLVLAVAAIVVYFSIPKIKPSVLSIDTNDISLCVGDTKRVNYSASINDAIVTLEIRNSKIAKLTSEKDGSFITGYEKGSTTILLKARHGNEKIEKEIDVVVTSKNILDENEPDVVTPPPVNPDIDPIVPEPEDNTNNETGTSGLKVEFTNMVSCNFEKDTIYINKNKMAIFSLSANVNIDGDILFVINSKSFKMTHLADIGNNTYGMTALELGTYKLQIVINNEIAYFNIVVQ